MELLELASQLLLRDFMFNVDYFGHDARSAGSQIHAEHAWVQSISEDRTVSGLYVRFRDGRKLANWFVSSMFAACSTSASGLLAGPLSAGAHCGTASAGVWRTSGPGVSSSRSLQGGAKLHFMRH